MLTLFVMKKKNCDGFCLLEWLIVIVMLTTMSVMGIDRWQEIKQRIELENETLSLFAFIQRIQSNAIFENKIGTVRLVHDDKGWFFVADEIKVRSVHKNVAAYYRIASSVLVSVKVKNGETFSFYGQQNTANPGSIILQNKQGVTQIIVSSKGRLRCCSQNKTLSRIPACQKNRD